ncbi:MAG: hypothetical protein COY69_03230 [Candidatus Magasanikbacteria bacterium CG_4_10_14_0_8_um_filter_32_14]|uniref:SIMPL domain-containing protein n=2 Tax=Candidatus Magasanikiibacteriota TaxID=1752731 RepID=A0A2M7R998_9BACT|nr:MAG: hypothetical protein AUJ23_03850 [Candidatus Magasanikbacteria bacterium CG1_02_32_51]PIY93137.1 MAG: hypothetical protein COY69_03230 [Candidatus Magasanikbacteria bacterium CG_4_10_14_0_8_um_filter_32_14]
MSVKKSVSTTTNRNTTNSIPDMSTMTSVSEEKHGCCQSHGQFGIGHHGNCQSSHFGHKLMKTFFGILLVYLIILVGSLIRNEIKKYDFIGKAPVNVSDRQLNISAEGKVEVKPNVSKIIVGNSLREATSGEASAKNNKLISDFVTQVKALGIPDTDIKTESQSMYPEYTYKDDGTKELIGYNITQNVTVKVRNDVEKASQVVTLAGKVGLNTIGGVESILDDAEIYLEEARQQAVKKVQIKAMKLANVLGISLDGVVSYSEYIPDSFPMYEKSMAMGSDMGGGSTIEPGTTDVKINVNITYKIR